MSDSYNNYSNYPQTIMQWAEKFDPQQGEMGDIARFQTLRSKQFLAPEEQVELNALAVKLQNKIFTSNNLNVISANLIKMQEHYRDNTSGELEKYKADLKAFSDGYKKLTMLRYQSWTTTTSKDYNIDSGNEALDSGVELLVDSMANLEIVLDGRQVSYDKYTVVNNSSGKKKIIRFNTGFTVPSGVRLECRWQDTAGNVFSVSSHQHSIVDVTDAPKVAKDGQYSSLLGVPSSFTPSTHRHPWGQLDGVPSSFTPSAHSHDDKYYTEAEINSQMSGKANTSHTHDDRYYTEGEINTQMGGKMNVSGGTFAGAVVAQTNGNYGIRQMRNTIISSSDPSGGGNGDVWIKFV